MEERKGKNEKWSRGGHRRHLAHLQREGGAEGGGLRRQETTREWRRRG